MIGVKQLCIVIFYDFDEMFSHHQKYQGINKVSMFTEGTYSQIKTTSVAVITDNKEQHSAQALLAIHQILQQLRDKSEKIIIIFDGAVSHFKNRYQILYIALSKGMDI